MTKWLSIHTPKAGQAIVPVSLCTGWPQTGPKETLLSQDNHLSASSTQPSFPSHKGHSASKLLLNLFLGIYHVWVGDSHNMQITKGPSHMGPSALMRHSSQGWWWPQAGPSSDACSQCLTLGAVAVQALEKAHSKRQKQTLAAPPGVQMSANSSSPAGLPANWELLAEILQSRAAPKAVPSGCSTERHFKALRFSLVVVLSVLTIDTNKDYTICYYVPVEGPESKARCYSTKNHRWWYEELNVCNAGKYKMCLRRKITLVILLSHICYYVAWNSAGRMLCPGDHPAAQGT